LGDGVTIGPVTVGLEKPAQIMQMSATVSEIMNLAAVAALEAIVEKESKVAKMPTAKAKKAKA